jgi:hypothetical protein
MIVSLFSVPSKPVTFETSGQVKLPRSRFRCGAGPSHCDLWNSGRSGRLGIFPGGFSDIHEIFHGFLARFQDLLPRFQELYGMIGITQLNMIAK